MSPSTPPIGTAGTREKTILMSLLNDCRGILALQDTPEEQLRRISEVIAYAHTLVTANKLANSTVAGMADRIFDPEAVAHLVDQIFDPEQEYVVVEPGGKVIEEPWHISPNGVAERVPSKRRHER